MKTFTTEWHHVFESEDEGGTFQLRVHKNLDQIQIERDMDSDFGGDETYIDVNKSELIEIRDFLTAIIGGNDK